MFLMDFKKSRIGSLGLAADSNWAFFFFGITDFGGSLTFEEKACEDLN
jgi:hypothetical protein